MISKANICAANTERYAIEKQFVIVSRMKCLIPVQSAVCVGLIPVQSAVCVGLSTVHVPRSGVQIGAFGRRHVIDICHIPTHVNCSLCVVCFLGIFCFHKLCLELEPTKCPC